MYAFEESTGEVLWSFDVSIDGASQFHGNPIIVDSLILFGTDEGLMESGALYCLNRRTGALVWKSLGHSGVGSDPAFDGDSLIYIVTRDDTLLAVSIMSGESVWSFHTGWQRIEDYEYSSRVEAPRLVSSPVVVDRQVVIIGRDSSLYSLETKTGQLAWSVPLGATSTSLLVSNEGSLVLGLSDYTLTTIDPDSGIVVRKDTLDYLATGGMVLEDGVLFFLAAYEDLQPTEVAAFDLSTRGLKWSTTVRDSDPEVYWYVPRLHIWKDEVVLGSTNGKVVGCSLESGQWNWEHVLDGMIRGVGHSDLLLLVGTFDGRLFALRASREQ
jgi:outer membrane protein assembly factor BamB